MQAAYMPFTYLSAATARSLAALVGPVVVYQPMRPHIPEPLAALASQGLVDLRTPILGDDDRLRAALAEFMDWARMNPGKSTAGAGFWGARQGEIPFFDETAINRIRSDIQRYRSSEDRAEPCEAGFSARLFLSLAQENDLAVDHLDRDLDRFNALEKDFLDQLVDADDAAFSRQGSGAALWREDPGGRLTAQRIRAWAGLAAADADLPEWLITTSPAVTATIVESWGADCGFEKLVDIRVPTPSEGVATVLGATVAALAAAESAPTDDLAAFNLPTVDAADAAGIDIRLYAAAHRTPAEIIRQLCPDSAAVQPQIGRPGSVRHTLLALIGC